jgi:hypothetical protein
VTVGRPYAARIQVVVHDRDGGLGTFCIYQASSPEKLGEHVERASIPATDIFEIADTAIVRPDPVAVAAWVASVRGGGCIVRSPPRSFTRMNRPGRGA